MLPEDYRVERREKMHIRDVPFPNPHPPDPEPDPPPDWNV